MRYLISLFGVLFLTGLMSCQTIYQPVLPDEDNTTVLPEQKVTSAEIHSRDYLLPCSLDEKISNQEGQSKPEKITLSLEQCLRIAREKNRQLLISREGKEKARGMLKEAKSGRYPLLQTNLSYTRIDEVSTFNVGGISTTTGVLDNYKGEVSLQQVLYQGGRIDAAIGSARLNQQLAEMQFSDTEELIIFQVTRAYDDVLLNQEIWDVNRKSLDTSMAQRDNIKALNKQGMSSDYELLRAEVQVSNLRSVMLQSESNLKLSILALLRTIGAPTGDDNVRIELTDRLEYKPQASALGKNFEQALETAFRKRPDLAQARLMIDIQNKNITMVKSELRPSFSLFANTGEEKPSRKVMGGNEWGDYWNAGATISFPLFEGGRVKGKLIQARADLQQYEISLRDTEEKASYEVRQAMLVLKDAEELIVSQKENVKQAEEGLRLAELGFKNGVNTQLEVMDAQTALDLARKNYLSAVYNYNIAVVMLEKATGTLKENH